MLKSIITMARNENINTAVFANGCFWCTEAIFSIFYGNEEEKKKAEAFTKELNESKAYDKPVVTQAIALTRFFEAEDYHHEYYKKNESQPYCRLVIAPKIEKLQKRFAELLK